MLLVTSVVIFMNYTDCFLWDLNKVKLHYLKLFKEWCQLDVYIFVFVLFKQNWGWLLKH